MNYTTSTSAYVHRICQVDECLAPLPPRPHIVEGLLAVGAVAGWYAPFGGKKTRAAVDLAVCVGVGESFLGKQTTEASVLYIQEDESEDDLRDQFGAALRGHRAPSGLPIHYEALAGYRLTDVFWQGALEEAIASVRPNPAQPLLLIIDSLAKVVLGQNENDAANFGLVLDYLRRLNSRLNVSSLVLHNANKGDTARGSIAFQDGCDTVLRLSSTDTSDRIRFESEKNRWGKPIKLAAKVEHDGEPWTTAKLVACEQTRDTTQRGGSGERFVRELLRDGPMWRTDIMAEATKRHKDAVVKKALGEMQTSGTIEAVATDGVKVRLALAA